MATGYTYDITNDISFEEFALSCSRAFIYHQRDAEGAFKPQLAQMTASMVEELDGALTYLNELKVMNIPAQQEYGIGIIRERKARLQEMFNAAIELRRKYESMLIKVCDWPLPNREFSQFKQFMVDQITGSIDADCDTDYFVKEQIILESKDPLDCYTEQLRIAESSLRHINELVDKEARAIERNNSWISDLYAGLGIDDPRV